MFRFFNNFRKSNSRIKKENQLSIFKRLELMGWEEKVTSANFVVSSLGDSGLGTLRQAMLDANAASSNDTITFTTTGTINLRADL